MSLRIVFYPMSCGTIHRYSDQAPPNQVPFNDGSEDEIDEDAYDLRDVSSDVEVNPDDLEVDGGSDAE